MGIMEHLNGQVLNAHEKADAALELLAVHAECLARIATNTESEVLRQTYQRVPFTMDIDGTGVGRTVLQVPQGIGWDLVSFAVVGLAAGNFAIYLGSEDGVGLLYGKAIPAAPFRLSDIFAGEEYVPQGQQVVIVCDTQTAGGQVRGNLKVNILPEGQSEPRG